MRTRTKTPMFRISLEMIKDLGVPKFIIIYLKKGNSEKLMEFPAEEGRKEIIKLFEEELNKSYSAM